ncbi:MAG: TolC family protein [Bdellovibrionota bacterium]
MVNMINFEINKNRKIGPAIGRHKPFLLIILSMIFSSNENTIRAATVQKATLSQLIEHGLTSNLKLKKIKNKIQSLELDYKESKKNLYYPRLDFSASLSQSKALDGPITHEGSQLGKPLSYGSALTLSQNIFNGLKDISTYSKAQLLIEKASLELKNAENTLIHDIKEEWLNFYALSTQANLLLEALKEDRKLLDEAEVQYKRGYASKEERDLQRLNHLQNKMQLSEVEQQSLKSKTNLYHLTGLEGIKIDISKEDNKLHLTPKAESFFSELANKTQAVAIEGLLKSYKIAHPQYKILAIDASILESERTQALANFRPKLNLAASWNYHVQKERIPDPQDPIFFTINFNYPIFSSFDERYQKSIFKNKLQENNLDNEIMIEEVKATLRALIDKLQTFFSNYEMLKQRLEIREGLLKDTEKRYKNGATNIRDLLEDKVKLQNDRIALARKINDIEVALNELDYIVGSTSR